MRTTRILILAGPACLSLATSATAQPRREADRPQFMTYGDPPPLSASADARDPAIEERMPWMERNMRKAMEIQEALRGEGR